MLTDEDVKKYQDIYEKQYGMRLDNFEARFQAEGFLHLLRLVHEYIRSRQAKNNKEKIDTPAKTSNDEIDNIKNRK